MRIAGVLLILVCFVPRAGGQDSSDVLAHSVVTDSSKANRVEHPGPDPYVFESSGFVTRAPSTEYGAGSLKRRFLGSEYRDVWTTPLQIPVIDLDRTAGGLTPSHKGGGQQTISLHLEGGDGHFYVLRSVDKSLTRSLPEGFHDTFINSIAQDQISSLNPLGSLILPPLARAAGILHRSPTLVVIPDSPRLGEFRDEFSGMLAQFERKPDEDQSDEARFGFSENIIGTERMFEKMRDDNDERVDERAFARARLFDMLIGDWDRHDGQWRWAEFETEHGTRFVAVPKDRDFAFVKFDGLINKIGRQSGDITLRRHVDFDGTISNILGLNWQGAKLDRQITASLARGDWVEIADSLQAALTDRVIDDAVRSWPPAVYELIGPSIASALKSRRDQLPSVASDYYDLLAETVDVVGTDKHERFEITRLNADETELVVIKTKKEGDVVRELFRRVFLHDETDEIRIYGLGGNDQFILDGEASDGVLIRIIGGEGDDAFIDHSRVRGPSRLTRYYDTPETATVESGAESKTYLSSDPRVNSYEPRRFELDRIAPVASFDYHSDDGIFIGGGVRLVRGGFRKDPYAARHLITFNYAPRTSRYNAYYDGRLISAWNGFDARLQAEALAEREFRNFYGFGNETASSERSRFLAQMQRVSAEPSLLRGLGGRSYMTFGPRAEYVSVDPPEGLQPGDAGVGYTNEQLVDKYLIGLQSSIALDGRDSTLNTRSGFYWTARTAFNVGVRGGDQRFGRLSSELRYFYTLPVPGQFTLALRGGGATNFGSFPFFEASTLGGRDNLRGFPRTRFAGRSAVFANAELRAKLTEFNVYLLKGELGVLGFIDHGRVWADDEDSDRWHRGHGGGVWMTPFMMTVVSGTLGFSEEGRFFDLSVGFEF